MSKMFTPTFQCHQGVNLLPRHGDSLTISVAGKVIVALVSHWPCIGDFVIYPPMGSVAQDREMSTPPVLQQVHDLDP